MDKVISVIIYATLAVMIVGMLITLINFDLGITIALSSLYGLPATLVVVLISEFRGTDK